MGNVCATVRSELVEDWYKTRPKLQYLVEAVAAAAAAAAAAAVVVVVVVPRLHAD